MLHGTKAALSAVVAMGLMASPGPGRAAPGAGGTVAPDQIKVERHELSNGLVVLLHEDHTVPAVSFWQWYKVGSRNEAPGITGISHYFEHMMFNGSKNVAPKEYDRILESNGGYSNAYTTRDQTPYFEEIASDRLDVLLRLDSDRMAELLLDPELCKSEVEVVKEERRLRTDNSVFGMLDEQMYATAFNASSYRWPVIGWMADLERITRGELQEYFRVHYAPNNCILVLVGDFQSAQALAAIEKAFGGIPRQENPAEPVNAEPEQRGERHVKVHYPAQNVTLMMGYKAPGVQSPDLAAMDVVSNILADGESSRLHRALVYDKQVALAAGAYFQTSLQPTLFEFYADLRPGKTADEGLAALDEVIARFAEEGPTERELQKAKNQLEANFVKSLKTNNGIAQSLGFHEHVFGDYHEMFKMTDRYRAVTAEDCKRVARELFDTRKRTVAELVPDDAGGGDGSQP